jgi:hypothetical protein
VPRIAELAKCANVGTRLLQAGRVDSGEGRPGQEPRAYGRLFAKVAADPGEQPALLWRGYGRGRAAPRGHEWMINGQRKEGGGEKAKGRARARAEKVTAAATPWPKVDTAGKVRKSAWLKLRDQVQKLQKQSLFLLCSARRVVFQSCDQHVGTE